MLETQINDIVEAARAIDPELQGRWIAERAIAAARAADANISEAIRYRSAAEHFRGIRHDILISAYRLEQGQLLTEEDSLLLAKAVCQIGTFIADMERRAGQMQNLVTTPTPDPAAIPQ